MEIAERPLTAVKPLQTCRHILEQRLVLLLVAGDMKQKLNEIRSQAVGNEPQNVQEKSETDTSHGIISFV